MQTLLRAGIFSSVLFLIAGCSSGAGNATDQAQSASTANAASSDTNLVTTAPASAGTQATTGGTATNTSSSTPDVDAPPKNGEKVAVIKTNQGTIVFKFFPEVAPKSVESFQTLAGKKFYDGTKFHRVIPGFMIQGGDPNTKSDDESSYGMGGPGYTVPAEFNSLKHVRGIVSMARSSDPNSAGSQFFIMVASAPSLDNQYSIFGKVVDGMDTVDKIVNLPTGGPQGSMPIKGHEAKVESIRIETWPLKK